MRHLVIIQWGGVNDNKNKHVLQHPLSQEYVRVSTVQSPSARAHSPSTLRCRTSFMGSGTDARCWNGPTPSPGGEEDEKKTTQLFVQQCDL